MNFATEFGSQEFGLHAASAVLVGPDRNKRIALTQSFRKLGVQVKAEVEEYPNHSRATAMAQEDCDAVLIDLDANPQAALEFVESLCGASKSLTAMLYTEKGEPELLVKCMRAGARELIYFPLQQDALTDAIVRAAARRETQAPRKVGKLHVVYSAKGGAGSSTVAANLAIALANELRSQVGLVDLNNGLGDLSVLLNLSPRFTMLDALRSRERLDWDFLSTLLTSHPSGVQLLAAGEAFQPGAPPQRLEAMEKLFHLLRQKFEHVVADAGRLCQVPTSALKHAEAVYVVTQVDVPSLRHAQRMATFLSEEMERRDNVQIVLNRFDAKNGGVTPAEAERALTFPVKWKIPNDYSNVTGAANAGLSVTDQNTAVAKSFRRIAAAAAGREIQAVQKSWKLFGFGKS